VSPESEPSWSDVRRFPVSLRSQGAWVDRASVRTVLRTCLEGEAVHPRASIGLLFCGDRLMRRLNRDFRGMDRTTDVLSFPDGDEMPSDGFELEGAPFLGDVAVSLPQCRRQAEEQGVDPGEELLRLLVHGVLHLLGYDHIEPADRQRMVPRERRYRARCARLGLGPGLLRETRTP